MPSRSSGGIALPSGFYARPARNPARRGRGFGARLSRRGAGAQVGEGRARPAAPQRSRPPVDAPGDGSLWAKGGAYKLGFDAGGATDYPAFGPRAPRSFAHRLSPERVTLGGEPLPFERGAPPTRLDARVELDRGSFVEAYDLALGSLEQSFLFRTLPRRGALELVIPVGSELEGASGPEGDEFRGALGRVRYGRATAIDARGRRAAAPTTLEGGAITIRVDAGFLAEAELPLVVDPVVSSVFVDSQSDRDTYSSDVAWDPTQQGWLVVSSQVFSATDLDVDAKFLGPTGLVFSSAAVDLSSAKWEAPRCANLASAQQFLVVAAVTSGASRTVMGRTLQPSGLLLVQSAQFTIGSGGGDHLAPDVGGDPSPTGPGDSCVVWEQDVSSTEQRIAKRLVDQNASLVGAGTSYVASGSVDSLPSISNSNDARNWVIVWTRTESLTFGDTWAARVRWDGLTVEPAFGVTNSVLIEGAACASTPPSGSDTALIAFTRRPFTGTADVWVAIVRPGEVHNDDLTTLENGPYAAQDQLEPCVDSDGQHFLVGYSELDPMFSYDDGRLADVFVADDHVGVAEPHVQLHMYGLSAHRMRIAAQHSTSATSHRDLALYDNQQNSVGHDVVGELFDGGVGGDSGELCFGDGSGVPCPCGNDGQPGHGCASSADPTGSRLLIDSGVPSTLADSVVLQATDMPPGTTGLFFQGTVEQAPAPFNASSALRIDWAH